VEGEGIAPSLTLRETHQEIGWLDGQGTIDGREVDVDNITVQYQVGIGKLDGLDRPMSGEIRPILPDEIAKTLTYRDVIGYPVYTQLSDGLRELANHLRNSADALLEQAEWCEKRQQMIEGKIPK
jgi:hypothetical protein